MRDVVDSVELLLLRSRDRLRNPRGGDPELSRRLGKGEPEPRHEVHRQLGSHGGDPAPATPQLELRHTALGLPAPAATERLGLLQPLGPGWLRLLQRIAGGQQPLHERAAAQDALVGQDAVRPLAHGPDRGPAAPGAEQPTPHQLRAAALRDPLPRNLR